MTGLCLQVFGGCLQLVGAGVTAAGLFYAWNRASEKFDDLRNVARVKLAELREQIARRRAPNEVSFGLELTPSLEMSASVDLSPTGTVEERLHRAENRLATLPGEVDKAIEVALGAKVAEVEAKRNAFDVQDIYAALAGIAITGIGVLLTLVGLLV